MSLQTARVQPRPAPRTEPPRPRLAPVTAPAARRRPRLAYAALAVGGALAIGAAQMGISLATTQDAFVLAGLNSQQHELGLQKQALHEQLVGMSSPQALAAKADAMGLVVAGSASYLRLSDGQVLGAGDGASWASTVNPNGGTVVGNALLASPVPPAEETPTAEDDAAAGDDTAAAESVSDIAVTPIEPAAPPVVTDGLPTPVTR
ncbi:hypothetical protein FVO59_15725 [Microbacterium esteraromaticum]|uniref:Cell division protein FtsL n=1 Tax=Microbacterium esteraromaticum TaxID=57043 RepID=A0A7D7WK70_9MICO|nr:hypothetical protein [Microbacterium esteraromaticum]QMU98470.1 hypothetical protein FVO59_15725 [Microbacterium esteraromaticum]